MEGSQSTWMEPTKANVENTQTFIEKGPSHQESQLATFPPIHWPLMTTSQACQLADPSRTPELHQCSAIQFTTHQLRKLLIIFIDILMFSQYL